jgi:hypothetical protein
MIRIATTSAVLVAGLLVASGAAAADQTVSQAAATAGQVTPAEAAPFIGDWSLVLDGPNGARTFALVIKVEKERVVGDITTATVANQPITDVTKTDKGLVLRYSFSYEGNPVDAVVRLTPGTDGKVAAEIDFAGGAYVMAGSATKKEKPAQEKPGV